MKQQETVQINIRLPKKVAEKLDTLSIIAGKKRPKYLQDTLVSFVGEQFPPLIWHVGTNGGKYGVYCTASQTWIYTDSMDDAELLARDLNRKTGVQ
jgi:hypothetical protein